jgi:putative transposase
MPWLETSPMTERMQLVVDYQRGLMPLAQLAQRAGVSRKTAYKWIARFATTGPLGLQDHSRRPHTCAHATAPAAIDALLALRRRHPTWGPKKLLHVLRQRQPEIAWPARSTAADVLARHGLVVSPRRVRRPGHPGRPRTPMTAPNEIWTIDFKGHFRTGDGRYCYPLTVMDGYSRYLLGCQALRTTAMPPTRAVLTQLFRTYGLPQIIRSDNGVPFATTALGRLSQLAVWWIRLGIYPELIEPASPQQNGRHERFHRTLKRETARPVGATLAAQQRRFGSFRQEYNHERPHEALALDTPATRYAPSPRPMPETLPVLDYPAHYEVRRVSRNGGIRWQHAWINVSHVLSGEHVGLHEVDDGLWDLHFGPLCLGRLDELDGRIEDALGRTRRRRVLPMSPD